MDSDKMDFSLDDLNLKKRYPDYFHLWIFRGAVLLMVLIFLFILYMEGFDISHKPYLTCRGPLICENPFYYCDHEPENFLEFMGRDIPPDDVCQTARDYNMTNIEFMLPGQTLGVKPKYTKIPLIFFGITALSFIVNHIVYMFRRSRR